MMDLSRRDLLKTLGIGTLGISLVGVSQQQAAAQVQPGMADMLAYYRFSIGDFEAAVISDSSASLNTSLYSGAPEAEILDFFRSIGITEDGTLANIVQILVINTGNELVIFDTGFGPGASQGGRLVPTLEAMGWGGAEAVTHVVISHFHPDHITGMSRDGRPVFPNAMVYWPQPEKDFMDASADNEAVAGLVNAANTQLAAVGDAVTFYGDGDEIVPGITAMAAHGHTPGHMAFQIESNGVTLINAVDSLVNVYAGMMHPEWVLAFDSIPDMAIENRKAILAMVSDSRTLLFGYHFPFPGIGYAARTGDAAWMWIPAAY